MSDARRRFELQVLPHLDAAYRFARWLSSVPGHADDVVQDAMLRAFRAFESFRGQDPRAWLFTIVRNCHVTAITRQRRRAHEQLPDESAVDSAHFIAPEPGPEADAMQRDDQRSMDRLMATLPENYREILVLRELEELDYRDIATIANIPIGTVMSRLARARAALRQEWQRTLKETA
jgi:RNA polymerase sigma-70 factor (ECF subfamily)